METFSDQLLTQRVLQVLKQAVPPAVYKSFVPLLLIGEVLSGLLTCFFGYRMFRSTLSLFGFLVGAIFFGGAALAFVRENPQYNQYGWLIVGIGALAGGYAISKLTPIFYSLSVIITGALLGATIAASFNLPSAVVLLVAVVGGIVAPLFERIVVISATAVVGAKMTVEGAVILNSYFHLLERLNWISHGERLNLFIQNIRSTTHADPLTTAWIALAILGFIVQYLFTASSE